MNELYSLEQAVKILSDFQSLKGKTYKGYTVQSIGMYQLPNNQPLYTVEVFVTSKKEKYDFMFITIHSFCTDNALVFDDKKYDL